MKTMERHYSELVTIVIPIWLLSALLILVYPQYLIASFHAQWLLLLPIIFLSIHPRGKTLCANTTTSPAKPWWQWLGYIVLLEFALVLILSGSEHLFFSPPAPKATLFSLHFMPFLSYALVAASLGFFCYARREGSTFTGLLRKIIPHHEEDAAGLAMAFFVRSSIYLSWAILLTLTVFSASQLLLGHYFLQGANLGILTLATLLLLLAFHPVFIKLLRAAVEHLPIIVCIALLVSSLVIFFCIAHLFLHLLMTFIPAFAASTVLFHVHTTMQNSLWIILFSLLLAPHIAGIIVYLSQGYSVRTILIGVLIPAILLCAGLTMLPIALSPRLACGMILVGVSILAGFCWQTRFIAHITYAILPNTQVIKPRTAQRFMNHLSKLVVGLLALSWLAFLPLVTTLVAILGLCVAILVWLASFSVIARDAY